jgi:magnesium chelatase subunit I
MKIDKIQTLGELKKSGYKHRSVKEEVRENLLKQLQKKENSFPGIVGYEDSVIPDTERALLSRHNILFLGLRGQAKTRMARQMINLLDEYIPYVKGSEINDDPAAPISKFSRELIRQKGDDTPIAWLHRSERYSEKLATPDVSVADLIGDIDPIKAANMRLNLLMRHSFRHHSQSNRGIVINEIPDLQARIQVSLLIFWKKAISRYGLNCVCHWIYYSFLPPIPRTNNRGSIVTPLKDRIKVRSRLTIQRILTMPS